MADDYLEPEDVVDNTFFVVQVHKASLRIKTKCKHAYFTVKCSVCGAILGSETKPDIIVNIIRQHIDTHVTIEEIIS